MATMAHVAELATAMPEVTETTSRGNRTWNVAGKHFVWQRPFSKADLRRFGDEVPPAGDILGAYVEDLVEKEALLEAHPRYLFTVPHFDGFPAVLVRLQAIRKAQLREVVLDAWLARAPERLKHDFIAD